MSHVASDEESIFLESLSACDEGGGEGGGRGERGMGRGEGGDGGKFRQISHTSNCTSQPSHG